MIFTEYIKSNSKKNNLILQPRMGVSNPIKMRKGLSLVKQCHSPTIGTITVDSYTRTKNFDSLNIALSKAHELNGYPITTHSLETTQEFIKGIYAENFPIQVRHGSPLPLHIFKSIINIGIDATEGGPISYCLPYGRTPLEKSIKEWSECCQLASSYNSKEYILHIESFGGCMLGQMCPPSMLIAISILECIFFISNGIKSVSLSYTQQTNYLQDIAALKVLRMLGDKLLNTENWHIVLYSYMGVFPKSKNGAEDLQKLSIDIAKLSSVDRLIVKTTSEAIKIPSFKDNINAINSSYNHYIDHNLVLSNKELDVIGQLSKNIYYESLQLIEAVLNINSQIERSLLIAFQKGILDIPYCLHNNNKGETTSLINDDGCVVWGNTGATPIEAKKSNDMINHMDFLNMLNYTQAKFDAPYLEKMNYIK